VCIGRIEIIGIVYDPWSTWDRQNDYFGGIGGDIG
jgi:hypothetical protein